MQALVATGPGEVVFGEVPDPQIGPGGVLVRTKVSAVSAGTERRMLYTPTAEALEQAPDFPVVGAFGYLAAGDVVEVGPGVDGIAPGDRVSCGRTWGAHRSLIDTRATQVQHIPDGLGYLEAAAAYWAVPPLAGILAAEPRLLEDAAVVGLGPLGLCGVQLLASMSRRVLALDVAPQRVAAATNYGAIGIDVSRPDHLDAIRSAIPEGPSVVVEASGTQAGLELALEIARPLGRIALVGVLPPLVDVNLFRPMHEKGLRLVPLHRSSSSSPQGGGAASPRAVHLPAVLEVIAAGRLDIVGLTSWVVPPGDGPSALQLLHEHPDRVLGTAIAWDPAEVRDREAFVATRSAAYSTG